MKCLSKSSSRACKPPSRDFRAVAEPHHHAAALAELWRRWPDARVLPPTRHGATGWWAVVVTCHRVRPTVSLHRSKAEAQACLDGLNRSGCCREEFWWCAVWDSLDGCKVGSHTIVNLQPKFDPRFERGVA